MFNRIRTTLFPILAAFLWGVAFVAQKGNAMGALSFNAARSLVGFLFLLVVIAVMSRGDVRHLLAEDTPAKTRTLWVGGACCGVLLTLASFLQQSGLDGATEAGKGGFLTAMYIVLVPLLGIPLKRKAPANVWVSVGVAVVGLYFLCIKEGLTFRASDLQVLACSLVLAVHILVIDHFAPQVNGVKLSCLQFLTVFVVSAIGGVIFEQPTLASIQESLMPVLYLGVFSSGIAYTLQIVAQRDANPTVLSLLLSLEAVFGVIAGAIVLKETLTAREYLGCGLMAVAVVLAQLPAPKAHRRERSA